MEKADEILELLKKGDKRGLEMLFQHFYRPLVMFALKFLERQDEAEDVVQEVFIKFWEQQTFLSIEKYLRSYLYNTVKNRCLNVKESMEGVTMEPVETLVDFPDTETPDEEEWEKKIRPVREEVMALPEQTRKVFLMIALEDKSYKEVADALGISVNTVKTALHRALTTLRGRLDKATYLHLWFLVMKRRFSLY